MFKLRDYQEEARRNMELLADNGDFQTMLAVGVGGGKTTMATDFTTSVMLPKGYKCLWFAPSQELINQAVKTITGYSSKITIAKVVAGDSISNHSADADYVLMTYQYAIRHIEELQCYFKNKKVLMVIDEGHHSVALSFQTLITSIKSVTTNFSLLGLTATPFRTKDEETNLLGNIYNVGVKDDTISFDTGIVYSISMLELIKRGWLAKPIIHKISTKECTITGYGNDADEYSKLLADDMIYNALVVHTYTSNRVNYGKTIIFAINQMHAVILWQMLLNHGVRTGIAISITGDIDSDIELNKKVVAHDIEAFRNSDLEVLVTCRMISEGFDVPETKTVFLAKPMVSRIECTQCIGRALRKKCDDNTAYVVYFDNSLTGNNISWITPDLITGLNSKNIEVSDSSENVTNNFAYLDDYLNSITSVSFQIDTSIADDYDKPYGFYLYENINGVHQTIVYDSNHRAFEEFLTALESFDIDDISLICEGLNLNSQTLPITQKEIIDIVDYYNVTSLRPIFYRVNEETDNILSIERYALDVEDMRAKEAKLYLSDKWEQHIILRNYYRSMQDFISTVFDRM